MSNNRNSRIRVNIHNNESKNDYNHFSNLVFTELYTPLRYQRVRNIQHSNEIHYALENVSMLNVMEAFFDGFMVNQQMGLSENDMMEIAMRDSLNNYKTQEKKPNIKLGIDGRIVTPDIKDEICSICVSNFEVGENITETKCKHFFHTNCIAEWVQYKQECPVCRNSIYTVDESKKEEKEEEEEEDEEEEEEEEEEE